MNNVRPIVLEHISMDFPTPLRTFRTNNYGLIRGVVRLSKIIHVVRLTEDATVLEDAQLCLEYICSYLGQLLVSICDQNSVWMKSC